MPRIGSFVTLAVSLARAAKRKLQDSFGRSTSGSLGSFWQNIRGTWFANGSSAQSDGDASTYPIAAADLSGTDMTVSASVSSGTGVAFWLTDSGSWWASTSYNNYSTYSYQCNPWQAFCFTDATIICKNGLSSSSTGCYSTSYIGSCSALQASMAGICTTGVQSFNCGGGTVTTKYDTCTGYNYFYYLSMKKSVSGTISSVVSDVSLSQQPAAIKVTTLGDSIIAQAYSDQAMTSALGSPISITPSSPNKGTKAGIIKAPTAWNQQSTVDNFSAEG